MRVGGAFAKLPGSGNGDFDGLTPGRLSGRVLTSSATGAQALSQAAIALVEHRKHRAQFTSAVEPWNRVAPHIEDLALLVVQWPSLGIHRARGRTAKGTCRHCLRVIKEWFTLRVCRDQPNWMFPGFERAFKLDPKRTALQARIKKLRQVKKRP